MLPLFTAFPLAIVIRPSLWVDILLLFLSGSALIFVVIMSRGQGSRIEAIYDHKDRVPTEDSKT